MSILHYTYFKAVAFTLLCSRTPDVISLQLFTPKLLVYNSSYKAIHSL
jgi:hypothetical protein